MPVHKRCRFVGLVLLTTVPVFVASMCAGADIAFTNSDASSTVIDPLPGVTESTSSVPCPEVPEEPLPLPLHTMEGYGGGAITPMAYLINPAPPGTFFGKPAFSLSYANLGNKNLDIIALTETLGGRVELGYGANRLGLGDLPMAIRNATVSPFSPTGIDIGHSDLWLHNFNVRTLLVKEGACLGNIELPAITFGVHLKYNDGIASINQHLGGALTAIGYRRSNGEEFTLTATRTIPPELLGLPLVFSVGFRESNGANLGFLGFSDQYQGTVEANVVCPLSQRLFVAYEYRQKTDPYSATIPGLINGEDDWHAVDVAYVLNKSTTFVAGWGNFGTMANTEVTGAWWLQLKYEF